jgi:hypothetical protein
VFPPDGNDKIVCGHCRKTIEENVLVSTFVCHRFTCDFCGAENEIVGSAA